MQGCSLQRCWENVVKPVRTLFAALAYLALVQAATAESPTYTNERFGTSATFPADIFSKQQEPPENGDGLTWHSDDGASLAIFGSYNVLDETPKSRQAEAKVAGSREVTYSKVGKNWLILSGFEGETVFYERYLFAGSGTVHGVVLKYPRSLKAKYNPLSAKIAASLKGP